MMRSFFALSFLLYAFAPFSAVAKDVSPMHLVSVQTSEETLSWTVELAGDEASRAKGLMFRTQMDDDKGMLFRFDETRNVAMWMKNTFISLDMLFIRENGTIARIAENTVPRSLDIISSGIPVRFVLEINAGLSRKLGLKPGMQLRHPWFLQNP